MTNIVLTICGVFILCISNAQIVSIPGDNFRTVLFELGVDINGDGEFQLTEVQSIDSLDISKKNIKNISGLVNFTSLKYLDLSRNSLSNDPSYYEINSAQLDLTMLTKLEYLDCSWAQLSGLDIEGLTNLKYLDCSLNEIRSIDFSKSTQLEHLDCAVNWIGPISDLDSLAKLKYLNLSSSGIYNIRVKNLLELEDLFFAGNSMSDSDIDIENLPKLKGILCSGNSIENLVLNNFPSLKIINAADNRISQVSVTNCDSISSLYLNNNFLENLDLTNFPLLEVLQCPNNLLKTINLSSSSYLFELNLWRNVLEELDVSSCSLLSEMNLWENKLTNLDLSFNGVLKELNCNWNYIETLDLENCPILEELSCKGKTDERFLKTLKINNCILLQKLDCGSNRLESLDISQNVKLNELLCWVNELISINISTNKDLRDLSCSGNKISTLDVGNNLDLSTLNCGSNIIKELDVSANSKLSKLSFGGNHITSIDLSNNFNLRQLSISNDSILEYMNIKNGQSIVQRNNYKEKELYIYLGRDLKLKSVCVDEKNKRVFENYLEELEVSNVFVSSLCSFTNGGELYNFNGQSLFDETENCEISNTVNSRLKYDLKILDNEECFFGNEAGEFELYLNRGTYEIIPKLENEDHFVITPASITIDLPQDTSSSLNTFCITPKESVPDVSISLVPLGDARPGFNTLFKLIYKNTGSSIISGYLNLLFEPEYVKYVSSSKDPITSEIGNLKWEYLDLLPFTSKEIIVQLQLNSPMDNPPLIGGQSVSFKGVGSVVDDSVELLYETVCVVLNIVNSFDPNDKKCLEGKSLLPEMIGEYVHYKIRFENTGTANATNVVVIDEIDLSKFDINSIYVVDASHEYVVNIENENTVKFVFENINLSFLDELNDGYVVFKIKTRSELNLNDVIENKADIYFDFNWPIETDVSKAVFELISSTKNTIKASTLNIFPNPAADKLTVISDYPFKFVKLFDVSGKEIISFDQNASSNEMQLFLPGLTPGVYLIQVTGENNNQFSKVLIN